jgi:proteic killer suppression protein
MEIAFESKSLRTVCESESQAKQELGDAVAAALKRRLADLRAATSINDLVAGRSRVGNDRNKMMIDLCDGYRLIVQANHIKNPKLEGGGVNWKKVNRIKIVRIERNHA